MDRSGIAIAAVGPVSYPTLTTVFQGGLGHRSALIVPRNFNFTATGGCDCVHAVTVIYVTLPALIGPLAHVSRKRRF